MNRGLVLSLCVAVALGAIASVSVAQTDIALNLTYNDPNDPSAGGTWDLVSKTDVGDGVVGISLYAENIDDTGVTAPGGVNANINGGVVPVADFGGVINVVYGQDLSQAVTAGLGNSAELVGSDQYGNSAWDNSTIFASGTFGGTRPVFSSSGSNSTDANTYDSGNNVGVAAVLGDIVVRGDSVSVDGLLPGDADRNWSVNSDDFNLLAVNFGGAGGWNEGDFDSSGTVTSDDFNLLAVNFGGSATPPAAAAAAGVPEPASAVLLALAAAGVLAYRKRR